MVYIFICGPFRAIGKYRYYKFLTYNRFGKKYMDKYIRKHNKRLSEEWLNKIHIINPNEFPIVEWEEDSTTSMGCNSFYSLDQYSDDCRNILMSPEYDDVPSDKDLWWMSQMSDQYFFKPQYSPKPIYEFHVDLNKAVYKTGDKPDTWVYLPCKQPQPKCYSIEFDFIPHCDMQETLQFDFCMESLSKRLRFNLENNRTLKFDVVQYGRDLYWDDVKRWDKFKKCCQLPLNVVTHVQYQILDNRFSVSFNGKIQLAIEIDHQPESNLNWALIFWNGTDKPYKTMNFEILNFKISHLRKNKCSN